MIKNTTDTHMENFQGPLDQKRLNPKDLIKEHYYLSKFLQQLATTTNIPTLPDRQSLDKLIEINKELEQNVNSFRLCYYQQFLEKKLNKLKTQYQMRKKIIQK